jgi:hypothetical protein
MQVHYHRLLRVVVPRGYQPSYLLTTHVYSLTVIWRGPRKAKTLSHATSYMEHNLNSLVSIFYHREESHHQSYFRSMYIRRQALQQRPRLGNEWKSTMHPDLFNISSRRDNLSMYGTYTYLHWSDQPQSAYLLQPGGHPRQLVPPNSQWLTLQPGCQRPPNSLYRTINLATDTKSEHRQDSDSRQSSPLHEVTPLGNSIQAHVPYAASSMPRA